MAASQGTILQKQELDALIVQAFAMEITNPNYLQDLQVLIVVKFVSFRVNLERFVSLVD